VLRLAYACKGYRNQSLVASPSPSGQVRPSPAIGDVASRAGAFTALGLTELHLKPKPEWADACPELRSFCPPIFEDSGPAAVATWSIEVEVGGKVVAEVVARRPLDRMDFDPRRLAAIVRGLVQRQLGASPRATSRQESSGVA
jgi:hypothetical protein